MIASKGKVSKDTSLIASLTLEGSARVIVPESVTLTVGGVEYTDCTLTEQDL